MALPRQPHENDPRLECAGYWDDDPDYPIENWVYEVSSYDTRRGYWEWVETKRNE